TSRNLTVVGRPQRHDERDVLRGWRRRGRERRRRTSDARGIRAIAPDDDGTEHAEPHSVLEQSADSGSLHELDCIGTCGAPRTKKTRDARDSVLPILVSDAVKRQSGPLYQLTADTTRVSSCNASARDGISQLNVPGAPGSRPK